jgi:3-polyprenyl-4-hydroxybenzoate decarboxylase
VSLVGWLDQDGHNLRLPNFGYHNGETAKQRALGKNRAEKARSNAKSNAASVTKALPEKRREEKRRVSNTNSHFEDFWSAWPKSDRKQDKAKCHEKWLDANLDELLETILTDIESKKLTRKWQDEDGKFIEAPLVYLNNRRWEDGSGGLTAPNPWAGAI